MTNEDIRIYIERLHSNTENLQDKFNTSEANL